VELDGQSVRKMERADYLTMIRAFFPDRWPCDQLIKEFPSLAGHMITGEWPRLPSRTGVIACYSWLILSISRLNKKKTRRVHHVFNFIITHFHNINRCTDGTVKNKNQKQYTDNLTTHLESWYTYSATSVTRPIQYVMYDKCNINKLTFYFIQWLVGADIK